jgi:N5-(cytidine 5'-diphosphoramidyl)-L-glutamine hydrolase
MKAIAITQRVAIESRTKERRDCLDQAWISFFMACGLLPVPVPNEEVVAKTLCERFQVSGLVLTGGNDLAALGGDAPERDRTEGALIDLAERRQWPVLGVCRGMQIIQERLRIPLSRVEGHVTSHQLVRIDGALAEVNSYQNFGTRENRAPFEVWAMAQDGVIKGIRDPRRKMIGIMWHPERFERFASRDLSLFRDLFGA